MRAIRCQDRERERVVVDIRNLAGKVGMRGRNREKGMTETEEHTQRGQEGGTGTGPEEGRWEIEQGMDK